MAVASSPKLSGKEDIELTGSPKVPSVVKYAFKHAPPITSEEQLLWRLVSARAVLDCVGETGFGPSTAKKHRLAVIDAQQWFRNAWDAARLVFDAAGVEIDGIREAMSEFYFDEKDRVVRLNRKADADGKVNQAERSKPGAC